MKRKANKNKDVVSFDEVKKLQQVDVKYDYILKSPICVKL